MKKPFALLLIASLTTDAASGAVLTHSPSLRSANYQTVFLQQTLQSAAVLGDGSLANKQIVGQVRGAIARALDKSRVGIALIMGGTNVTVHLTDGQGFTNNPEYKASFTWQELQQKLGLEKIEQLQDQIGPLMLEIAEMTMGLLQMHGIRPENVVAQGASIAGDVEGPLESGELAGTNMPVHMHRVSLIEQLLPSLGVFNRPVPYLTGNDAYMGLLGEERAPEGLLRKELLEEAQNSVYLIWGTGVGGRDRNGRVWEIGHSLVLNVDRNSPNYGNYEVKERNDIQDEKTGRFPPKPGYVQLEHRVGGPWAAIRFLKETKADLRELSKVTGISVERLQTLKDLPQEEISDWSQKADEEVVLAINKFMNTSGQGEDSKLKDIARVFEFSMYEDWGKALKALHAHNNGNMRVVIGSSMAEIRRDDPDFVRIVRNVSGLNEQQFLVSNLNGSGREAIGAAFVPPNPIFTGLAVTHDPSNQWKPHSQSYTLTRGNGSMSGEIFWMLDHVYIRIGNRWVRAPSSTYPVSDAELETYGNHLPWASLLSGPLLLGNPDLQEFMRQGVDVESIVEPLPDTFELVVEKRGFMESRYDTESISDATDVLSRVNPFSQYRDDDLTADDLADFLDAYILIAGAGPYLEKPYDQARQLLNFFIGAVQDRGASEVHGISIEQLKLLRVLGEKRKLGFNFITADLVSKLKNVVAESVIPNGEIFILGKEGRVVREDAINQGNLVATSNAPHIHDLENDVKSGIYSRYVVPFLMYGGNATRIRDTVFANKVTGVFFWLNQAGAEIVIRLLHQHGYPAMAHTVQTAYGYYQISMLHLLSLLMPPGIYLAGTSSLVAGAEMVGSDWQLVQNIAHQIDEDGSVKPLTSDLAGHGDAVKELISSMRDIQESIRKGGVIVLSNAEYYDPAMYDAVAMQVVRGKNVTAIAVFPQSVKFTAPGFDYLADAFESGKLRHVAIFGGVPRVVASIDRSKQLITFEDGTTTSVQGPLEYASNAWSQLHAQLSVATAITDPVKQRDQIIDIMSEFEERLQKPFSSPVVKVTLVDGSEKSVPLFSINTNDGGMLSEVQGVVSFVEKSQFGADHVLRKSDGESIRVSRKTLEAVWFKDFNPQFFGWDSFAVKACLTQQAQTLYREYRQLLASATSEEEKLALRDTFAQKINDANPELTPETWSQLAETFDLLQSVLMVPPFEAKGKAGVDRYFKINKMAQQVMTFMVAISLSNVNMEDIDLNVLRETVERLQSAADENERMAIRNSLTFLHGKTMKDLAQVEVPGGPVTAGLIRVETDQFVQVKKPEDTFPFSLAINRFFTDVAPDGLLIPSTMGSLDWAAAGNTARDLLSLGVLSERLAFTIGWAAWHEGIHETHVDKTSGTQLLLHRTPWEKELLKEFRDLVVKGLSKDNWTGWLSFANKWKDTSTKADVMDIDFGIHRMYSDDSLSNALPRRAA